MGTASHRYHSLLTLHGGARPNRSRRSKHLGFRSMVKSFWLSLIDPGNEDALVQSTSQRSPSEKSSRPKKSWFGKKDKKKQQ